MKANTRDLFESDDFKQHVYRRNDAKRLYAHALGMCDADEIASARVTWTDACAQLKTLIGTEERRKYRAPHLLENLPLKLLNSPFVFPN